MKRRKSQLKVATYAVAKRSWFKYMKFIINLERIRILILLLSLLLPLLFIIIILIIIILIEFRFCFYQKPDTNTNYKRQTKIRNVPQQPLRVETRVGQNVNLSCPALSRVYQLDGTFKVVVWYSCTTKNCSAKDTQWTWLAGLNSQGKTKTIDTGSFSQR